MAHERFAKRDTGGGRWFPTRDATDEHTPGPWRVTVDGTDIVALEDTPSVLVVASTKFFEGPPTSWERGNARLIAAAPDLLSACELALAFHGADTEAFVARYGSGMTTRQLCDVIRAVIAKATRPELEAQRG